MNKEITHSFHFSCEPNAVLSALIKVEHIQNWWTKDASFIEGKGVFRWREYGWVVDLLLDKSNDDRVVTWKCLRSNMQNTDAWEGSTISFELTKEETGTELKLRHFNYKNSPCYDICFDGWAFVVGNSMKHYLETGKGLPYVAD
ncbi:MAG: SRPBCC domain-containing protein [Bacteriovorax sp.]|nr:SRPBCC domain-containing protein [Bacteriovorax sp.]